MSTDTEWKQNGSLQAATLPTQHELPCEDDENLETERHKLQMDLLIYPLRAWLSRRQPDSYVGANMFVYFSLAQVRGEYFRGPDVFVVLGVPPGERRCWVVWHEGKGPDVVIELLSDKTARQDKGRKKQVYEQQLQVPEYFWYDPFDPADLVGFELQDGVYRPIAPDGQGYLASHRLGLVLRRWEGVHVNVRTTWLRWARADGTLLPTPEEAQAQEQQRAETEKQRAETEKQRAETAEAEVARLRALMANRDGP